MLVGDEERGWTRQECSAEPCAPEAGVSRRTTVSPGRRSPTLDGGASALQLSLEEEAQPFADWVLSLPLGVWA